jgi:dTDP-4-dehydrorhamnose reductase
MGCRIMLEPQRILVLGASGMLGNAMFRLLHDSSPHDVWGSVRTARSASQLPSHLRERVLIGANVEDADSLTDLLIAVRPTVVINCVGLVKQLAEANDPLAAIPINSLVPHRLARLTRLAGGRFIHFSTDCVFSGKHGGYNEGDQPDAYDLYGRSKLLGEVDGPSTLTLRTSIIGHELQGAHSLINWFLSQEGSVRGFRRAIFSGMPTVCIAEVVRDYILPRPDLEGLYHLSAEPIDKHSLLALVAQIYNKPINIVPDDDLVIDRSLNSQRFRKATGFVPMDWPALVSRMKDFK